MIDPVSSAAVGKTAGAGVDSAAKSGAKVGPSKFDKVRRQQQEKATAAAEAPQLQTQTSAAQRKVLEGDLRKRLEAARGQDPKAIFRPDLDSARVKLDALRQKAQAIPTGKMFDSLRERLTALDGQFQNTQSLLERAGSTTDPHELLQFQVQMYQFTQNVDLMSRVVEQVNSGTKQILQTQV